MDTSAIVKVINEATTGQRSLKDSEKAQLIEACTTLISSLESPIQKLLELLFGPVRAVAVRLGIDMNLFDVGANALEKGDNVTLEQLSAATKCEALLIKRIMRILIDMKMFKEIDQDIFQPQSIVAMFKTDAPTAQAVIHFTTHLVQLFKLPEYFAEKGYQCPNDAYDGPFQYAMGTKLHAFDWLAANPKNQHAFNVTMALRNQQSIEAKWFEIFPVERLLKQQGSDVFMVDVGGSLGHHLIEFKEAYPDVPGKLIDQDIAPVIESIESLPPGIETMVHDFFKPQPVRLAKVYFISHILHDWPDKQAKIILEHIRNAMGPDSVLLLNEAIMPEKDVSIVAAVMDLNMMAAFSSLERTEKQFKDLLDDAGLQLVQIWTPKSTDAQNPLQTGSIMEARLKC